MNLEDELLNHGFDNKKIPPEKALLIACGLKEKKDLNNYIAKVDEIYEKFKEYKRSTLLSKNPKPFEIAKTINNYIFNHEGRVYEMEKSLLTDAIDAIILRRPKKNKEPSTDSKEGIGNCLALTALFSILGLRENLNLSILLSYNHVLSNVKYDKKTKDIENCFQMDSLSSQKERELSQEEIESFQGVDPSILENIIKKDMKKFQELPLSTLPGFIYLSKGGGSFNQKIISPLFLKLIKD